MSIRRWGYFFSAVRSWQTPMYLSLLSGEHFAAPSPRLNRVLAKNEIIREESLLLELVHETRKVVFPALLLLKLGMREQAIDIATRLGSTATTKPSEAQWR